MTSATALLPKVLDIRILGACDLRCPFCFGPRHELGPMRVDALVALVGRLPTYGVEAVVLTGGEPTLVRELPKILRAAKEAGLRTILSTNGLAFQRRLDELGPLLDWVGLPLDGDDPETNRRMRLGDPRHFEVIKELLSTLHERFPTIGIKLGTVVCALNKDHVAGIAAVVKGPTAPDVWKLYQVAYSSYGGDNETVLALDDVQFDVVLADAERAARHYGIPVVSYRRRDRDGTYLFIEPNADVMVVRNGVETIIGNFLSGPEAVIATWHDFVNPLRLEMNMSRTYPNVTRSNPCNLPRHSTSSGPRFADLPVDLTSISIPVKHA